MMTMPRSFAVTSVPFHSRTPVVYSTDILSKGFAVGDSSSVVSFNISRSISIARAHRANRKLWIKHRIEIHMSASPKSGGSVSVTNLNGKSTIDRPRFGNVRGKRRCQEDPRSNHTEKDPGKCPRKTEDEESGLHYHNEEVPCISETTYEIWSPLDAAEAANVLLRMLEDDNQ